MASQHVMRTNSDVEELRKRLDSALLKKDQVLIQQLVRRVIEFMTLGLDVSQLFFTMINVAATHDIIQKKLVYLYICTQAESNAESALLTVNTLVNDALDPGDAKIRGLALRSMFNMRLPNLVEHMKTPLLKAFNDPSSYVRQIAVMSSLKLFKTSPMLFEDLSLLSKLYQKINDENGQVSFNAICCLDEILQNEGGLKFDKELVSLLLFERLASYNEWHQCILFGKMIRYTPDNAEEVVDYLNVLDSKLHHTNKAVVMATINLFLQWTKSLDDLRNDVFDTVKESLLSLLKSCTPELQITLLNHVVFIIRMQPRCFSNDYRYFFIKLDENASVKYKKLEILLKILTEGNMNSILHEIRQYVFQSDNHLGFWSLKLLREISLNNHYAVDKCIDIFLECVNSGLEFLTASALENLQDVMRKYKHIVSMILPELDNCWELVQNERNGKEALIWMYGEYGEAVDTSPYKLEEIIDNIHEEKSISIKFTLLSSIVELFLKRPPECGDALKKYLRYCIDEEKHLGIRDKGLFYLRILQNINQAEKLFESAYVHKNEFGVNSDITSNIHCSLDEFNTLSVLYGYSVSNTLLKTVQGHQNKEPSKRLNRRIDELLEKPKEVVVGDILNLQDVGDLETTNENEIRHPNEENDLSMVLLPDIKMTKAEFEFLWKNRNIKTERRDLGKLPNHNTFIDTMRQNSIYLLASSPPSKLNRRYLFYAKTNSEIVILLEITTTSDHDNTPLFSKWILKTDGDISTLANELFQFVTTILEEI